MMRIIKYIFDTKSYSLTLKPYGKIATLKGISDSEFAGDQETRKSVYDYVVYYCGALISWKSKSGNSATLSSTKAEYYAASETGKELQFTHHLVSSMTNAYGFQLPFIMGTDNTGAVYLANNYASGPRTKNIDIRTHYIRELIINDILKIDRR
jgi:hypothetical protein